MAGPITVLRALIDAAFKTGSISDAQQVDLHHQLDAAEAPPEPEVTTPEPAPDAPAEAPGYAFGQESAPGA